MECKKPTVNFNLYYYSSDEERILKIMGVGKLSLVKSYSDLVGKDRFNLNVLVCHAPKLHEKIDMIDDKQIRTARNNADLRHTRPCRIKS